MGAVYTGTSFLGKSRSVEVLIRTERRRNQGFPSYRDAAGPGILRPRPPPAI